LGKPRITRILNPLNPWLIPSQFSPFLFKEGKICENSRETAPSRIEDQDVPELRSSVAFFFAQKERGKAMARLFLTNIPCDCEDGELRGWLEAQGFSVDAIRVVRDMTAGVSPAFGYVSVHNCSDDVDPIGILDGQDLRGRKLQVRKDWRDEHHRR
jgi:RNA recognition motif-containing protein